MYFFYFDESGSRDPSTGTPTNPKDHLYVLLAVGMYERQWRPFESSISNLKLRFINSLKRDYGNDFDLADCEVKSNWVRIPETRRQKSPFLDALTATNMKNLTDIFFQQVIERNMVIVATVIDKRYLYHHITHETLHTKAYEFVLERIQNYMYEHHRKHQALIVMDDTSKQLNRAVAMKHAFFQRAGNKNVKFKNIVEYPFFTRSELSNGVQLADLLAYNVYRAFKDTNLDYPYFTNILPNFYRGIDGETLHGLKVWPDNSPLVALRERAEKNDVGLGI